MSKLFASMRADGVPNEVTRRADESIVAHLRGWNSGARVVVHINDNDEVVTTIFRTSGSEGTGADVTVAQWTEGQPTFVSPGRPRVHEPDYDDAGPRTGR